MINLIATPLLMTFASFVIVALASWQVGNLFTRIKIPKITGYLFTGLLAGGFVSPGG